MTSLYSGHDAVDHGIVMPAASVDARISSMSVDHILNNYENYLREGERNMYPWADRFVMGFPLPEWQRGFVWTEVQQRRFILSIWMKGDIGSWMVNDWEMSDGKTFDKYSNILQDGQQRLTTIELYVTDRLTVNDVCGVPRLWSELSRRDQRRFGNTVFPKGTTKLWDEHELRAIYDLRNFSGTAHKESERALPAK